MAAANITRWIGIGMLGLPLYGALTFWSSLSGQPDPDTQLRAWARYVTTTEYVIGHVFGSILGLIFLIFGAFALGAYLTTSRAGRMGLWAMFLTVLGSALFLPLQGVTTFAAPEEGQAVLAGLEEFEALPDIFANTVFGLTSLVVILLGFVGHILIGVAVWRSGTLPRWAGALWAGANVLMYLSFLYGSTIGPASTPFTVPLGAVVLVISGAWMAYSVLSRPSGAQAVGAAAAQPRVR
jgi:Ca2+/Na+ antiporter